MWPILNNPSINLVGLKKTNRV